VHAPSRPRARGPAALTSMNVCLAQREARRHSTRLPPPHIRGVWPRPLESAEGCARRSTGPALFVGGWAVQQPWLFWVALIAGALLAGLVSRALFGPDVQELPVTGRESTSSVASVP
jgi:hypothetical protein